MPADRVILYGPLGEFARALSPEDALCAEEVYIAALAVWSTAIAPTVEVRSFLPGIRPPQVWTAFVGGKGSYERPEQAAVRALRMGGAFTSFEERGQVTDERRLYSAVHSARRRPSRDTSALRSTLLTGSPFRWTPGGRCRLQDYLNSALQKAWDGSNFLSVGTERRTAFQQEQDRVPPMVGTLWSISDAEWEQRPRGHQTDAFYSRFLPFRLRGLPGAGLSAPAEPPVALIDAYVWALGGRRRVELSVDAARKWAPVRELESSLSGAPDAQQAVFTLRAGEHALRVAAALAVADGSSTIRPGMVEAAWSVVRRSVLDASELSGFATGPLQAPFARLDAAMRVPSGESEETEEKEPGEAGEAGEAGHTDDGFPDTLVERKTAVVRAQDRDSRVVRQVKEWYDHTCQICGTMIELPVPPYSYSEAAHIQALGAPHNGPDRIENVLCLCPNCHIRFDRGARFLTDDLRVIDHVSGKDLGPLRVHPRHRIRLAYVQRHRARWSGEG
ncbi:HNH endonuclease [Streptomyces sp. NPDC000594]|uniref:HNH endonuclease n=1 Tax=Streptomyces sp. NPDC000594 TaxID=3154261 RepID=UPI00331E3B32